MRDFFNKISRKIANAVGSPWAFVVALGLVVAWGLSGPIFQFSDTWQLVINTSTTIVTFLMVFLIQNTQNHDSRALHLKLDELIRALDKARNEMIDLEDVTDEQLNQLETEFKKMHGEGSQGAEHALEAISQEKKNSKRPRGARTKT